MSLYINIKIQIYLILSLQLLCFIHLHSSKVFAFMKDKRIRVNHEPIFYAENSQVQNGIFAHFAECDISRNCEAISAFSFSNCCERTSF